MKRKSFFLVLVVLLSEYSYCQKYKSVKGIASFFSEAPIENIDANSNSLSSALDSKTNEIVFTVPINSFRFKKAKMQEHFNEKYLESDKYPDATYKGKIKNNIDWKKDGTHKVIATGTLTIHNVSNLRTDTAAVTIRGGSITIDGNFYVRVADHHIEIPKLVIKNIAEVVSVKFNCEYAPAE